MKKCLLALLSSICLLSTFSQVTYTGALAGTDSKFNRPDQGTPPATVSVIGTSVYYDVIPINITTTGLVTFYCNSIWDNFSVLYNTAGFNATSPLTNALVAIDDYDGPNSGFTYNFTATGIYYLVICSFKNDVMGAYNIDQSVTTILPFRLLSFSAAKTGGNTNTIKWLSADESNLQTYQVQRGADGKNFDDLKNGRIEAKNSSTAIAYKFVDNNPGKGNNYYRLKITEIPGTIYYGPIAIVKNSGPSIANMHVFPNPSSDYLRIEIKSMQNKNAFVTVITSSGAIIQNGQYVFNDKAVLSVDIKRLPPGKYYLKTTIGKEVSTTAFIKR